jgi:Flp pilus assembly protein TadG
VQDECGGITIFVLVISVLMLVVGGMAVDFQRQEMARADLQNALDRGVLAATNANQVYDTSGGQTEEELAQLLIAEYVESRSFKFGALNVSSVVTQMPGGRAITASADEPLNTIFLRMMGLNTMNVAVGAGAIQAAPKLEITLVLDVSGSMGWDSTSAPGTKLAQLKVAAKEFLETILTADSAAYTLITIVPFSQQVNLPRSMADLYNLDRHHDYASCFDFHDLDFSTTAMPTNSLNPFEQGQHFIDVLDSYGCPRVGNAITPFSNNLSELKNAIDAFAPESYTATYMGMKWGAAMLDPTSRPVVDAMIANNELSEDFAGWPHAWNDTSVRKITVLMSDGQNTKLNEIRDDLYYEKSPDYWDENKPRRGEKIAVVDNDRTGEGDDLLRAICDQAKIGANSTLYTIGFELADEPKATAVLEYCASSLTTHYLVDGAELSAAFKNIADDIVNLKLTN